MILPSNSDLLPLYIGSSHSVRIDCEKQKIAIYKNGFIDWDSVYNSLFIQNYLGYTYTNALFLRIKLKGKGMLSIYHRQWAKPNLLTEITINEDRLRTKEIPIPMPKEKKGRIYFTFSAEENTTIEEAEFLSQVQKTNSVKMAVIITTFHKEHYVKHNVHKLVAYKPFQQNPIDVFVIDNGRSLKASDLPPKRVFLIPNKNTGGAGGFGRGFIEAYDRGYSHFVYMDDDIEFEPEVILRLFRFFSISSKPIALSTGMIDIFTKFHLFEFGADYRFFFNAVKKPMFLDHPSNLDFLAIQENYDYSGFWLFGFSRTIAEKAGIHLPLFIRGDDQEYCIRLKTMNIPIILLESALVLHEPFYAKVSPLTEYHTYRNNIILTSIMDHFHNVRFRYWQYPVKLFKGFLLYSFNFRYDVASMIIEAIRDFRKGPKILFQDQEAKIHALRTKAQKWKTYKLVSIDKEVPTIVEESIELLKKQSFRPIFKFFALITLGGHILPSLLLKNNSLQINSPIWFLHWRSKKIINYFQFRQEFWILNRNSRFFFQLLVLFIIETTLFMVFYVFVKHKWKKMYGQFQKIEPWKWYIQ